MTSSRELDLVVWGATGFTGKLAVACLSGYQADFHSCTLPNQGVVRDGVRFGIAGRNEKKLQAVKESTNCPKETPIFIANADDAAKIEEFVKKTKVVISCSGPFALYSDVLIGLCAKNGTHYVDITGEVAWVRSVIDRYDDLAKSTGAVICSMCGMDSIPFDLLALYGVNRLKAKANFSCGVRRTTAYLAMNAFGFSGGSLASGILMNRNPVQLTKGVDLNSPFLLGGIRKGGVREEDTDAYHHTISSAPGGLLSAPSTMAHLNSRVVRRSAMLLGYGNSFNYGERSIVPNKKMAEKALFNAKSPAPPEVLEKMISKGQLPKPGEGPTVAQRKASRFTVIMHCEADDGTALDVACSGGECGYEETARMVVEAGLQLAKNPLLCPGVATGGVLTPAAALGENLARALTDIGIEFSEVDADTHAQAFFQTLAKM